MSLLEIHRMMLKYFHTSAEKGMEDCIDMSVPEPHDDVPLFHVEGNTPRDQWFEHTIETIHHRSVFALPQPGVLYCCPCCHYKTLDGRGCFDICPVCFWEDDGQDEENAAQQRPFGPNHTSLTQARANFQRMRACEEAALPYVRPPLPEEM